MSALGQSRHLQCTRHMSASPPKVNAFICCQRADAKWSFYEQCQITSEVNEGFTRQRHYAGLRAQAHVQLAGRQGRTESKVVRAPLQGPACYISTCCARTRAR